MSDRVRVRFYGRGGGYRAGTVTAKIGDQRLRVELDVPVRGSTSYYVVPSAAVPIEE